MVRKIIIPIFILGLIYIWDIAPYKGGGKHYHLRDFEGLDITKLILYIIVWTCFCWAIYLLLSRKR